MNNTQIENYTMRHWPAHEVIDYDGWNINFSSGYTKRANSINVLNASSIPLDIKMTYCEDFYKAKHLPTIFKLTSFQLVDELDKQLENRGYIKIDESYVLTAQLAHINISVTHSHSVEQSSNPTEEWLNFHFKSKGLSQAHKEAFIHILNNVECDVCYFTIKEEGVVVACCLGTVEDEYVSVYCLETALSHRKQGLAATLLLQLFNWAKQKGATKSYLLVVADNIPALSLYTKIGYNHQYSYWYRIQNT